MGKVETKAPLATLDITVITAFIPSPTTKRRVTRTTPNSTPETQPAPKMPPATPSTRSSAPAPRHSALTHYYLLAYNVVSFCLWAVCLFRGLILVPLLAPIGHLPAMFNFVYSPLLTSTQSLAVLEILHSVLGIVRAPVLTTTMQVASRLLLVWGVMYPFRDRGDGRGGVIGGDYAAIIAAGKGQPGAGPAPGFSPGMRGPGAKWGDLAFLGCLIAWGVTECIRYSFFAMHLLGKGVQPWFRSWLTWWRYNTFYVLYPVGISSECILIILSLDRAAEVHPLYRWFLVVVLAIYVPGSYILYTHMIAQRQKALRGKKRAD